MIDPCEILINLAKKRPIFHSEADFQHAFAWELHQALPNASVRLELPVQCQGRAMHIDLWITNANVTLAIELKYKTRELSADIGGEQFRLKSQSAQDIGRYDFIKDIHRLEQLACERSNFVGWAILLTNDSAYWTKTTNLNAAYASFRLDEGRSLKGELDWGPTAGAGTKRNHEEVLVLNQSHPVHWQDYSKPSLANYGRFRFVSIEVLQLSSHPNLA